MAIYHTRIKMFSRSKGHSAVAAAAYRAGLLLFDDMTGIKHDYRRRSGVVTTRCFAPLGAPEWATEPQQLWREVRMKEKRKDSQEAREFEIALPCELTDEQRSDLAWDICRDLVGRYGFAIQASIHEPPTRGGQNWHLHALATTRRIRDNGLHDKTRELDGGASGKAEVEWVREMVASRTNDHLAAAGHEARVDHRNFGDQLTAAIEEGDLERAAELAGREATLPMGKSAIALQRLGADCAIADANRSIRQRNARRHADLRQSMAENGYLPAPSEGHGHEQALRDRQRELEQPIALGGSGSVGSIQGLGPLTDLRTPAERQDAKRAEARTAFSEAAKLWAEDFIATIDLAFAATRKLLAHHAERAATFAHLPSFRADVRAFVKCLKRLKEDALRFRRRLETEDRLSHLVSQAQTELTRFDGEHPHPGLWTKRQWQMRRARRFQAVGQRQEAHRKAVEATQPEAQADYTRRALETGVELERVSTAMLARYPLQSDLGVDQRAAPSGHGQTDTPLSRGPRL
ncbi:MobA/MobL family protein [Luteimonas sp. SMYT11W]|uniref:MobA/MobL family protein n=1 Tax=Luteimonas flava TaxID=3115822 RepID=A0ABU7WGV3_9GAMM